MSVPMMPRPFSWDLVEVFVEREGWSSEELGRRAAAPGDGVSVAACRQRVARWKRMGGLTVDEADRVATALGVHPSMVWGEAWWEQPLVDVDAVFRQLRSRERRLRVQQTSARRVRARRVAGYTTVERALTRGPHRCAPDGCCGARNTTRNVEMAA